MKAKHCIYKQRVSLYDEREKGFKEIDICLVKVALGRFHPVFVAFWLFTLPA